MIGHRAKPCRKSPGTIVSGDFIENVSEGQPGETQPPLADDAAI